MTSFQRTLVACFSLRGLKLACYFCTCRVRFLGKWLLVIPKLLLAVYTSQSCFAELKGSTIKMKTFLESDSKSTKESLASLVSGTRENMTNDSTKKTEVSLPWVALVMQHPCLPSLQSRVKPSRGLRSWNETLDNFSNEVKWKEIFIEGLQEQLWRDVHKISPGVRTFL